MRIFNKDDKINFVDDNNVLVGFDYGQSCCENFGWFMCYIYPRFINDSAINPEPNDKDFDGWNFDKTFFKEERAVDIEGYSDEGGIVVFRLTKKKKEVFLALYNSHNGYYSHGFEMKDGVNDIFNGSI